MYTPDSASNRLLCAEPLESRWLLSALPLPAAAQFFATMANGPMAVVELGPAANDDATDVQVAPTALPPGIRASLAARFPGARLVDASLSLEGSAIEYSVDVRSGGRTITTSLTPGGEILDIEETLPPRELPTAVIDWMRRNFPGAQIEEVSRVNEAGVPGYDMRFAARGGEQVEVSLRPGGARCRPSLHARWRGCQRVLHLTGQRR
jgi:hypothetical protein